MSGAKNKCQKLFICNCYPNGKVQDCAFKVSSYWLCDCQAAIDEHIALCNSDAANRAADTMDEKFVISRNETERCLRMLVETGIAKP